MSVRALSHLVIAARDVKAQARFFCTVFELSPYFENDEFAEVVLPSRFRIAFFRPVGKSARYFNAASTREGLSIGITVHNVEDLFERLKSLESGFSFQVSGPPKEHPWGEKSFLLIDPEGNRWEVTQSPSEDGMLVNRSSS